MLTDDNNINARDEYWLELITMYMQALHIQTLHIQTVFKKRKTVK